LQETSQLSADAASFVPEACHPVPAAFGSKESREYATLETSVSASAAQQRLPHYLTSCYPFITGDPGIQPRYAVKSYENVLCTYDVLLSADIAYCITVSVFVCCSS